MSGGGTVASAAVSSATAQVPSPNSIDRLAPTVLARFQKMPAASGTKAPTSVTLYALCTMSYMVLLEFSANSSAASEKVTSTMRSVRRNCRSVIRG